MKLGGVIAGSVIGLVAIFGLINYADAAVDMFLKVENIANQAPIEGESTTEGYENWIDILSVSWGVSNPAPIISGGGGGAGKASFSDFNFVKKTDKSSPKLFLAVAKGEVLPSANFHVTDLIGAKVTPYIIFNLDKVRVTSYSISGAEGTDRPTESLSLNFAKVQYEYSSFDKAGKASKTTATWSLEDNAGQ